MRARPGLLIVAMLLLVLAVGTALTGPPSRSGEPPATEMPAGELVERTIPAAEGSDTRVEVQRGDVLHLEVEGDELDGVLLERLDQMDGIEPTTPARFDLLIDAEPGIYPIRLVDADRRVGAIVVTS